MTIHKAITAGITGNEISKKITGSSEVSVGRTVVATGAGAVVGAAAAGTLVIGAAAVGIAAAPVTVPLTLASALCAGIASLFD